ncbi:MAG: glycosyl hydrolase family 18 protein [Gammaproteobacteria bacterium]|nr:glycosyl hydrolase family 18 protein [Gammaproteobacteria bacterium]
MQPASTTLLRRPLKYLLDGILVISVLLVVSCIKPDSYSVTSNEAEHTHKIVLGWVPYWDQDDAMESFQENIDLFTHISLFWYVLDESGKIKKYKGARESRELIRSVQKNGVKVLAIITNLPDDDNEGASNWDPERVWEVIKSKNRRQKHVADLIDLVNRMGFDGINIDYEALPGEYRSNFTQFIQLLGEALQNQGKVLAVALHPKTSEDNPMEDNGSHAQDWSEIHPYVDQMHFMTYGEHYPGSQPGPLASPAWVDGVLNYAIEKRGVPVDKVFLGLPLYGEVWERKKSNQFVGVDKEFTYRKISSFQDRFDAEVKWSDPHGSPYQLFEDSRGVGYVAWFENKDSIREKLKLKAKYGINNIGLWRLGEEDPGIWEEIRDSLH